MTKLTKYDTILKGHCKWIDEGLQVKQSLKNCLGICVQKRAKDLIIYQYDSSNWVLKLSLKLVKVFFYNAQVQANSKFLFLSIRLIFGIMKKEFGKIDVI